MADTNGNSNGHNGKVPNVQLMMPEQRKEIERGLRFSHVMMEAQRERATETLAQLNALADILIEKGIIQPEEIEARLDSAREQVLQEVMPHVRLTDADTNKYDEPNTVEIDCENRIHLCGARCCTFRFVLTRQDLREGVAEWDYGNPYWIRQRGDGYCVHNDETTRFCGIHAQRPHVCRVYDCRRDKRVWIDYENYIPAPLDAALARAQADKFSGLMPIGGAEFVMREQLWPENQDAIERELAGETETEQVTETAN